MATLSGAQIVRMIESEQLLVDPFDRTQVQPATLDLRLGHRILAAPINAKTHGMVIDLDDLHPSYRIQPGQMIGVLSREQLRLPLDIVGRFGIRSRFARIGLNAFGGVQLDPGFKGVLTMNLLNVGPEPVTITRDEPFFTIEFHRLEEPAQEGYSGPYQHQFDFPADQYNFIISARATSSAEMPLLRKEIARLNALIEELEERLPDPDEGLELRPEIEERLRQSRNIPDDALVSMDEVRRQLGL